MIKLEIGGKTRMKYIEDIIDDLKQNPESYRDFEGQGVYKNEILISRHGNGRIFSIIRVYVNGVLMPTTYCSLWRLETAITHWYNNVSLRKLILDSNSIMENNKICQ